MSFFDSEACLPVRTAVEEEENYDLTFYDCGPGESSESAYETSTDYLDEIDSFVDQEAAEDTGKESYIPKEFGQAFTFNFDDSQTLSSKPAQNVEARDEFFGGSKPSRSSGYISSDSSCSSAESTAFPSDHPIFRFSDQPAEAPLATPVREPTVQPTIAEDHHLESVAKELIFSPVEKNNSTTTSTKRCSTSFAVLDATPRPTAAPVAATHSSAPLSSVKKAPAPKAALSILPPKMNFATSAAKKAPGAGAPVNRPKTAPAQTAAQPAPRVAPQGGMKRSAEGATNTTSANPPPTTTTTTSKMTTTARASAAAKDSPQPSLFSPPATTSSFFSSTDASGNETSVEAINKTAVHFVTPSGPKTSATAEEDHLFAGFSRFSPTPAAAASAAGSASSGSERNSASATGIAMLVSPTGFHPTDEDNEPPPYSQQFMPTSSATGAASTADPSTSDAEALQCCEDMGLRVEEGNERLAKLKQAEREGRAKMVQKMAETARLQGKFLAMDCMSTLAPLLLDLKLKIDQLHLRQKRIEEVRLEGVASLGAPDLPPSHESQRMDTSAVYDEVEQEVQQEAETQITMTADQQNKSGEVSEGDGEKVEGWGEENRFELVM